jgi:hypothetical protein
MNVFRNAIERLIEKWLAQAVDLEQRVHLEFAPRPVHLEYRVLTPAVQRRVDESA